MALVTALSHARPACRSRTAPTYKQRDREMIAADALLRELDTATVANDLATA